MNKELTEEWESFIVDEEEASERIDKVLAKRFQEIKSRTYFQFLIEQGHVLVNGVSPKKRLKLKSGDEIQFPWLLSPEMNLEPEDIPLDIVYEDEDILIVNKPAGMVVHPAPGHWSGTFANALLHHCRRWLEIEDRCQTRPGIVHRLDKETTGLLMAAKSTLAHQRLVEMFGKREIHKEYLAICFGNPGQLEIRAPIGRHPIHRQMMAVVQTGKPAHTICQILSYGERLSLVRAILVTGRTHQIRVHMKQVGAPILGDPTYGNLQINAKYQVSRQLLHAELIKFIHPFQKKALEFRVPLPEDMKTVIKKHHLGIQGLGL